MVTHIKRHNPSREDSEWVKAVRRLSDDPKRAERAMTVVMLLGIELVFNSVTFSAAGDRITYGIWMTSQEAAVAYCVAEGIDIET